jgi:hypothetical protein
MLMPVAAIDERIAPKPTKPVSTLISDEPRQQNSGAVALSLFIWHRLQSFP